MKKLVTILAAGGLALGMSACGSSNGPEQAVEDFGSALKAKDYEAVCDAFDPELVSTLEEASQGQDCAEIFKENEDQMVGDIDDDAEVDVQDSEIAEDGKTATVTVKNKDGENEDLNLVKVDDEWKLTME